MKEKLMALFNTMAQIETKGDSTIKMADCLKYLKELIEESNKEVEVNEVQQ